MATLSNPTRQALSDQTAWIYMPVWRTATQQLQRLDIDAPHELLSDRLGHCIATLNLPHLPPLASKIVAIHAELAVHPAEVRAPIDDAAPWLRPERFIEVDDVGIRALALQLARETRRGTLDAIYQWVGTKLRYEGYLADDRGARDALLRRSGDCTEYACLAVALARANGVSARMVGGYVAPHSAALRAEDYHNWAEVHLDGQWRVLDAQKGCWGARDEDYIAFRIYRDEAINPIGSAHRFRISGEMELRL